MDEFQERYEEHQKRKADTLLNNVGDPIKLIPEDRLAILKDVMENRRSQRTFTNEPIADVDMHELYNAIRISPSSCNRQAIYVIEIDPVLAEYYLVGGKGWINNANKVLLVFAADAAYKSPNERGFMPYLDAGFACQNVYLMCEALGIGCCFVNPNMREEQKQEFNSKYSDFFCGAIALGYFEYKSKRPPIRSLEKIIR